MGKYGNKYIPGVFKFVSTSKNEIGWDLKALNNYGTFRYKNDDFEFTYNDKTLIKLSDLATKEGGTTQDSTSYALKITNRSSVGLSIGANAVDLQSEGASYQVASGDYSVITGGLNNWSQGDYSVIGGGSGNHSEGNYSIIIGGEDNSAEGLRSSVVGGLDNVSRGENSFSSGENNNSIGAASACVGGSDNLSTGDGSLCLGGFTNNTEGEYSVIIGGVNNTASTYSETVLGAFSESISGTSDSIVSTDPILRIGAGTLGSPLDIFRINKDGGIFPTLKSGINQVASGASTGELWVDTSADNVLKLGV